MKVTCPPLPFSERTFRVPNAEMQLSSLHKFKALMEVHEQGNLEVVHLRPRGAIQMYMALQLFIFSVTVRFLLPIFFYFFEINFLKNSYRCNGGRQKCENTTRLLVWHILDACLSNSPTILVTLFTDFKQLLFILDSN